MRRGTRALDALWRADARRKPSEWSGAWAKLRRTIHGGEVDAESLPGAVVRRRAAQASMGGRLAIPANKSSLVINLSSESRMNFVCRCIYLVSQGKSSKSQLIEIFKSSGNFAIIFSSKLYQW